jgi:glutamine amidotransferase-like uncharacterized protein
VLSRDYKDQLIPIPTINRYKNRPFFRPALLLILPIGQAIPYNQRLAGQKNVSVFNYVNY